MSKTMKAYAMPHQNKFEYKMTKNEERVTKEDQAHNMSHFVDKQQRFFHNMNQS
jgi:hypothetical protein